VLWNKLQKCNTFCTMYLQHNFCHDTEPLNKSASWIEKTMTLLSASCGHAPEKWSDIHPEQCILGCAMCRNVSRVTYFQYFQWNIVHTKNSWLKGFLGGSPNGSSMASLQKSPFYSIVSSLRQIWPYLHTFCTIFTSVQRIWKSVQI